MDHIWQVTKHKGRSCGVSASHRRALLASSDILVLYVLEYLSLAARREPQLSGPLLYVAEVDGVWAGGPYPLELS